MVWTGWLLLVFISCLLLTATGCLVCFVVGGVLLVGLVWLLFWLISCLNVC